MKDGRQPVHTVYGGAHLFRPDTASKLGAVAVAALDRYASSPAMLASAFEVRSGDVAARVYDRLREKLVREPVEDYRIDFEDGYGHRPDEEEDAHGIAAARAVIEAARARALPAGIGIRIKPFIPALQVRALRTLDLFVSTLCSDGETVPPGFVVTLPKVSAPDQLEGLAASLTALETQHDMARGTIGIEMMVEDPEALLLPSGAIALPEMVRRAEGRLTSAHFGAYDYLSACNVAAAEQRLRHPLCDFVRSQMHIGFARSGVRLVDGATSVLPVPARRGDAGQPTPEDVASVHAGWKHHYDDIRHGLACGFYQGWDVHPAQLVSRYTAVYAFFFEAAETAGARLRNYVESKAGATRLGGAFDDAATAAGLVELFIRGLHCGAFADEDVERLTSLSVAELHAQATILRDRR